MELKTVPEVMRAVLLTGHGGLDKLEYREDVPTPRPSPGEVLIKVGACGLNNTDVNTRTAWYSDKVKDGITESGGKGGFAEAEADQGTWSARALTFPRIQGADAAGRIVAVGDTVPESRIGQRVLVDPWLLASGDWLNPELSDYFGSERNGGFADYAVVPSENAVALTTDLTDAELATFPCALTTAENLVRRTAPIPGETVVITGASGGVGGLAVQLCRLRGLHVIAIASEAKAELVRSYGADAVIPRDTDDLEAAIREAAGGPIEIALDVVGGEGFSALIGALRPGGRYSSSGAIGGPEVAFNLRQLIYKDLQMTGATIVPPGTMARLVKLIERGAIRPSLAGSFPLRDLAKAQETFMAKRHVGNIVVTMEAMPS